MGIISNKRYGSERALYGIENTVVENCRFEGEEDGESALKESRAITVKNCFFDLRYPLWHGEGLKLENCEMTENCRAALWYDKDAIISDSKLNGIKALRECKNVSIKNCEIHSLEFGWKSSGLGLKDVTLDSEYAFLESRNVFMDKLNFNGKYSFQYVKNVIIKNSVLNTKDAFWHAKNVTAENCVLDGEYIGWYSEGLTLLRCHIKGTQPFCYCKNLKLVDCTMENCDLAFEYSDVDAEVKGVITSVKNPRKGRIIADEIGEIIHTSDSKYTTRAKISIRKK